MHWMFPMEPLIEKLVVLPKVEVQLATVYWETAVEHQAASSTYCVCQRLSDNHAPLRIGNISAREAFPRVRSVGFLPPGCSVRLYPMERPFRLLNCSFDKEYFEEFAQIGQKQWEEHTHDLVSIRDRRLELMMQEIYAELVQPDFAYEMVIEAASTMILVELARYGRRLGQGKPRRNSGQGLAPWQLRRIYDRIEESEAIGYPSLDELSKLCGISQSHLMRTFKVSTGWPIHKYIAEDRLMAAKRLLASGQLNAKEIAGRLGFRSPAYFATAFRRMTGTTPSEYRLEALANRQGRS